MLFAFLCQIDHPICAHVSAMCDSKTRPHLQIEANVFQHMDKMARPVISTKAEDVVH
jgi:hypothetical protein